MGAFHNSWCANVHSLKVGSIPSQKLGVEGEMQGEIGLLQTRRSSPLVPLFSEDISQCAPQEPTDPLGQTNQADAVVGHLFGAPDHSHDLTIPQLDSLSQYHALLSDGKHRATIYPSHPSFEPLQSSESQNGAAASQWISGANKIQFPAPHTNAARSHQENGTRHQIGQLTQHVSIGALKAHRLETRANNIPLASVNIVAPLPVVVPQRGRGRPRGSKKSATSVVKSSVAAAKRAENEVGVGIDVTFQVNLQQQQAATQNSPTLPPSRKRKQTGLEPQKYHSVLSATRTLKRRGLNTVRFALETEFHEPAPSQVSGGHDKAFSEIQLESEMSGHARKTSPQVRSFRFSREVQIPDQLKAFGSVPKLSMNYNQTPYHASALASGRDPGQISATNIPTSTDRRVLEDERTLHGVTAQVVAQAYKQVAEVEALLRKSIAQKSTSGHPGSNLQAPSELTALHQRALQKAQHIFAKFSDQQVEGSRAAEPKIVEPSEPSSIKIPAHAHPASPSAKDTEPKAVDLTVTDTKADARAVTPRDAPPRAAEGRAAVPLFREHVAHKTAELKKQNAGKLKWLELSFGVTESELPPHDLHLGDADYFAKYMG